METRYSKHKKTEPWFFTWQSVKRRCNYPKARGYKHYGGRGIKNYLSKEQIKILWFRDKANKMIKPSIDRIDRNAHYTFDNCRFIEFHINSANTIRKSFTHCPQGHPYKGRNLLTYRYNSSTRRVCRSCRNSMGKAWYKNHKERALDAQRLRRLSLSLFLICLFFSGCSQLKYWMPRPYDGPSSSGSNAILAPLPDQNTQKVRIVNQ